MARASVSLYFLFCIIIGFSGNVFCKDFFVSHYGTGTNCTISDPCGSLSEGINTACTFQSTNGSDVTVYVSSGLYLVSQTINITCPNSLQIRFVRKQLCKYFSK